MKDKILIILSTLLLIAVGIEGYYIYNLSKKLNYKVSYYKPVKEDNKIVANQNSNKISPKNSTTPLKAPSPVQNFSTIPLNPAGINPFKEFQKMQEQMNKLFGSINAKFMNDPDFDKFFQDFSVSPSLDMKDMGDKYVINVDIPGSKENNIKVSIKNHILKVEAKVQNSIDKNGSHFLQKERFVGNFEREITLPSDADEDSLKTKYINGILVITLNKKR